MRIPALLFSILFFHTTMSQSIDIQGHRGARGIMPENTIPAFLYAMDQGVTTLELDVVITKDKQVLVSHEPWMSHEICMNKEGQKLTDDKEKYNIYNLTYYEIKDFDCGSMGNGRFPEQVKMEVSKPLLAEVIKLAERHSKGVTHKQINYNIEIKSTEEGDNKYHPPFSEFSDIVYQLIDEYLPWERVTIQSFDFRTLRYWNDKYPEVQLAVLIENIRTPKANIKELGFTPEIYSPYYKLIGKNSIQAIHQLGMKVIPWTVNEIDDMKKLVGLGVNGLITDYPNRAKSIGLTKP
ncbi:glycerophosphodiester phosphodiesterase family protein [Fulvivirga lutea]|uniref:Glycerophosphodiester phosphodiesterase n=1 Tax=Fulvivirga lutea TaxID=2810512 RepID=A0A974WGA8_9BACT|nr:glycerophosphodiester phosphodiesterase family protein [Fulvivirga lutea]QSE97948.1 glycerophosphodiester phosphodiesterase [Fulvivirga lutea]